MGNIGEKFLIFLWLMKGIIFKNKDVITGKEILNYNFENVVDKKTETEFLREKKLVQLNNIYYLWDYSSNFKKMIFSYKFKRKIKISKFLARIIKEDFKYILDREKIDMVISVPINKKRKNDRGFNQVDEILKEMDINYLQIKRVKNTKKMYTILDEKLRIENIRGSFEIDKNIDFRNKNILIFDDIITTGSTLREIKNSILNMYEKSDRNNMKFSVFCLAAALEIKKSKGEI